MDLSTLKKAYRKAHFLILPSKSEGWPKAISEAMFYGVIPIATRISCVPYMLGHGERGILISSDHKSAVKTIEQTINGKDLKKISTMAASWSQKFTLEYFESEIIKILKL